MSSNTCRHFRQFSVLDGFRQSSLLLIRCHLGIGRGDIALHLGVGIVALGQLSNGREKGELDQTRFELKKSLIQGPG